MDPHDQGLTTATALRWTIVALSVVAFWVCWPVWPALVLAVWTASLARPLLVRFERRLHSKRLAAAVLSVLLFVFVALPISLIVLGVLAGAHDLARALGQSSSAKTALQAIVSGTDLSPSLPITQGLVEMVIGLSHRYGAEGVRVLTNLAGVATEGLVALLIYFAGAFVFLVDGPAAWAWLREHSPLQQGHLERFAGAFQETGRGLLVGVGLTSATQGLVATLVYLSLGVPRWWVLGPITGLASMIPLIGSSLIWAPITIGFYLTGHPIKGTLLAVLGVGIISTVDNILHPIYAHMGAIKMPIFLLLVTIFGGLAAFGTWGAVLGPLVVRLWLEALVLHRESVNRAT